MNNRVYHIVYTLMLMSVLAIVLFAYISYDGPSVIEESFPVADEYMDGWTDWEGHHVDTLHLHHVRGMEVYEEYSIYNIIPDNLSEGQYICFRSKNVYIKVFVDGALRYEPYVPENIMYTKSTGTRWHYIPISFEDCGKEIEIQVIKVYESGRASVDNIYIGEPARVIMDNVQSKVVSFITSILMIFVGIIMVVADIPVNMRTNKNHELLYLGLFSLAVAVWCITETHLTTYFLGDPRTLQLVSCFSLALIAIPMMLYLDAAFGFRKRMVVAVVVTLSTVLYVVSLVMHFAGVKDIHETLYFSHISLIIAALMLLYTIIRHSFVMGKNTGRNMYRALRGVGLCSLSVATGIDLFRYYNSNSNDTAMFVRIGFLIFIICFGLSSLEKTINVVKLGARTELVAQLAYKDGLTGIGNRTAFEESLVDFDKIKDDINSIGIVMFDVNDLKKVNDNLGHRFGDKMLVESADIIREAFVRQNGECFRIGGDEFAVILSGEGVKDRYEKGMVAFHQLMNNANLRNDKEYDINIAHGFAIYDENQRGRTLMNIYELSDARMYEEKKMMKLAQANA